MTHPHDLAQLGIMFLVGGALMVGMMSAFFRAESNFKETVWWAIFATLFCATASFWAAFGAWAFGPHKSTFGRDAQWVGGMLISLTIVLVTILLVAISASRQGATQSAS